VRDEHGLGIERLVVETIAAVAVAAGAHFVEERAVYTVLRDGVRVLQQRKLGCKCLWKSPAPFQR
jgi:hypothetical protein